MHSVNTPVPFLDLSEEFTEIEAEWMAAVKEVGETGQFILGPNVSAFESECAAYVGSKHAVAVANGTESLILSLRALGLGPGDEVITTPFTFFATSEAIVHVGANPVFADVEENSYNIDPESVRARITERTRAIVPVHLFGRPADMKEIQSIALESGLHVVEDCAQAFGANVEQQRVGSIGDLGAFSFYPTKILGCYGDGGMITTSNAPLAEHLRRLRNHGAMQPFKHIEIGHNSRLDEIQAALLRIKLRRIDAAIFRRREIAGRYNELLVGSPVTVPPMSGNAGHVFNLYTIRTPHRDRVREHLTNNGVACSVFYPVPLHLQEAHARLGYRAGDLPVSEQLSAEVLSLPIYPDMKDEQIERVCEVVKEAQ